MAKKTTVIVTSDISGQDSARTVTFAYDGVTYEIDMTDKEIDALTTALHPYVEAARRTTNARRKPRAQQDHSEYLQKVREWARSEGFEISDRGRVSRHVIDSYEAQH